MIAAEHLSWPRNLRTSADSASVEYGWPSLVALVLCCKYLALPCMWKAPGMHLSDHPQQKIHLASSTVHPAASRHLRLSYSRPPSQLVAQRSAAEQEGPGEFP